jgi:hypothetical protein
MSLLGIAVLYLASLVIWRVGTCVVANVELRDDMQDMASQLSGRIGLTSPSSDEDFRQKILRRATEHGIDLTPDQVIIRRTGPALEEELYLAADYTRQIHIFGQTYTMHFTPEASRKTQPNDWRP